MSQQSEEKGVDLKRYRTKKLIEDLKDKKGFHTELVSLYIPPDKKLSDVTNYLKNEVSESQNIKSKLTRKNVLDSISSLLGQLRTFKEIPKNGLIMFSGAIPQNDTPGTEKNELYIVEPPNVVNTFRYHCDSKFLLWPLEDMLQEKATYGLIVIGRQESAVGYVKGNRVEVVREFTSGIHSKHRAGGQSQRRFERLIEEGEKRFYRRISDEINKIFLDMEELRGIFIGGPGPSKEKFVRDESLDYRLQEKIMDVVDLGYGGSEGIRALLERVKDNIEDIKYIHEKKVMQKFMSEITSDSGLATYGIKEVEKGLNYGAVDMLIISEELDKYRAKLECSNCGYTEHRIIKEEEFEDTETIIQDEVCPKCSSNTFGLVDHKSLVEAFGEMAESTGADIEIISKETEEGETLYSTFGGVVALLRYKFSY
ncbi:MAG: Peptide chain release factor subunit 1 [Promethearchaeota archaeon]|jgi:peptide chain release factor subunit 1|nr:MAG: Peptide chain release factor subunit 1 [Candidatus Lokiarchaeota archaeon]